jgi:ergothioneine biosynthesis protein EgtB
VCKTRKRRAGVHDFARPRDDETLHEEINALTRRNDALDPAGGPAANQSAGTDLMSARAPAGDAGSAKRSTTAFIDDPVSAYTRVRAQTCKLCEPLEIEDYGLQSMTEASPVKWHLAHTTWFFETFVLGARGREHEPFDAQFGYLFNSYYETVGRMHPRPQRGLLSRPTVARVRAYREHVDAQLMTRLARGALDDEMLRVVELGLHHEQQHQELILTDLKHGFSCNSLRPAYRLDAPTTTEGAEVPELRWIDHPGGVARIGHQADAFAFDNEGPPHRVFVEPFGLASRLVTCGEYLAFMADGGYARPELWLADGWDAVRRHGWQAPLYWERTAEDEPWRLFTLHGVRDVDPNEPVVHVSLYEADAFARWTGFRLPSEAEWEVTCRGRPIRGNFVEREQLHPVAAVGDGDLLQAWGDTWEWTGSAYAPYPAYRAPAGALGEYNGKFMSSQIVLRGGSCVTPRDHMRVTYRNFFHPSARWQFSGIRLARDR